MEGSMAAAGLGLAAMTKAGIAKTAEQEKYGVLNMAMAASIADTADILVVIQESEATNNDTIKNVEILGKGMDRTEEES